MKKLYEVTVECKNTYWDGFAPSPEDTLNDICDTLAMAEERFKNLVHSDLIQPERIHAEFLPAKVMYELTVDEQDMIKKRSMLKQEPLSLDD